VGYRREERHDPCGDRRATKKKKKKKIDLAFLDGIAHSRFLFAALRGCGDFITTERPFPASSCNRFARLYYRLETGTWLAQQKGMARAANSVRPLEWWTRRRVEDGGDNLPALKKKKKPRPDFCRITYLPFFILTAFSSSTLSPHGPDSSSSRNP